jgi:hypothetical protein
MVVNIDHVAVAEIGQNSPIRRNGNKMNTKTAPKSNNVNPNQKRILREFDKLKKQFDSLVALLSGATAAESKATPAKTVKKGTKTVATTKSHSNRPTVREVVRAYIQAKGPSTANDLFYMAKEKHGGWSRHSLYRVLHDAREFKLVDSKYEFVQHKATPKKAAAAA